MSTSKTELFDKELQTAALFYKALSHPARLAILNYLAKASVCMTGDISNELPLSRTTVNQHLSELKETGLIRGEISGVKVNYCLNTIKIQELNDRFGGLMKTLGCCDDNGICK